jgi:hypothetical protein
MSTHTFHVVRHLGFCFSFFNESRASVFGHLKSCGGIVSNDTCLIVCLSSYLSYVCLGLFHFHECCFLCSYFCQCFNVISINNFNALLLVSKSLSDHPRGFLNYWHFLLFNLC